MYKFKNLGNGELEEQVEQNSTIAYSKLNELKSKISARKCLGIISFIIVLSICIGILLAESFRPETNYTSIKRPAKDRS